MKDDAFMSTGLKRSIAKLVIRPATALLFVTLSGACDVSGTPGSNQDSREYESIPSTSISSSVDAAVRYTRDAGGLVQGGESQTYKPSVTDVSDSRAREAASAGNAGEAASADASPGSEVAIQCGIDCGGDAALEADAEDADAVTQPIVLAPLTVFLAGDSTVSTYRDTGNERDQAGWGQMLGAHFTPMAVVDNRAIGGATARRFIDEGHLEALLRDLEAGDYLFVQFGTNDGNKNATYRLGLALIPYYLEPSTDFKVYLLQYIEAARERDAIAVLVTPPPRNSAYCTGGNGTGAHAQAMRELGVAEAVQVIDLNQAAVDYLQAICPSPVPEDFFLLRPDGSVDGTHFQVNGARILASFVADGIRLTGLPLAEYLLESPRGLP